MIIACASTQNGGEGVLFPEMERVKCRSDAGRPRAGWLGNIENVVEIRYKLTKMMEDLEEAIGRAPFASFATQMSTLAKHAQWQIDNRISSFTQPASQ